MILKGTKLIKPLEKHLQRISKIKMFDYIKIHVVNYFYAKDEKRSTFKKIIAVLILKLL
jgi:hypothetical protein